MRRTVLTALGWTAFLFAIYVCLGFRPVPPDSIGAGEVCYRCHHVITDARLAAEMLDGNLPTKYKTAGCMARYVATHPGSGARYYVTDSASGSLIPADRAYFVSATINDLTGERDYRAFVSRSAAETSARSFGTTVLTWKAVVTRAAA